MDGQGHPKPPGEGKQDASHKNESLTGESGSKDSKGKEREPSMLDRIQSSAKGISDAMTSGDAGLRGMLPSSSSKVTPSGPGGSKDIPGILQQTSQSRSSQSAGSRGVGTFRETRVPDNSSQAFDEFVNAREPQLPRESSLAEPPGWTAQDFEATDGSAVVDLLSQPLGLDEMPGEDDQDDGLAPEAAEKLREALFGSSGSRPFWDDLLNFTPQFLAGPGDEAVAAAQSHLGTTDLNAAREIWLGQWQDVLSAYTDEVWGDLGPLAVEARKEVGDLMSQEPDKRDEVGGGALGRLRMILAHVRGST